jgi:hypothetical protein
MNTFEYSAAEILKTLNDDEALTPDTQKCIFQVTAAADYNI